MLGDAEIANAIATQYKTRILPTWLLVMVMVLYQHQPKHEHA